MSDISDYKNHIITDNNAKPELSQYGNLKKFEPTKEKPIFQQNTATSKRDITIDLSQFLNKNNNQQPETNKFFNE